MSQERACDRRTARRWRFVAAGIAGALLISGIVLVTADGDDEPRAQASSAQGRRAQASTVPGPSPTTVPSPSPILADNQTVKSVTVGGPGFVAVGYQVAIGGADAAVWTSVDGATWSRVRQDDVLGGPGNQVIFDVTAGGPGLVAVGRDSRPVGSEDYGIAAVWTSVDGSTWSRVAHDDAVFGRATGLPDDIFNMKAVTVGGPGLVAVGGNGGSSDQAFRSGAWIGKRPVGAVWTSVDGITWSRVPHDPKVFGEWEADTGPVSEPNHGLSAQMRDVTAGGPGLVAVGDVYRGGWGTGRSATWTSTNGLTWSLATENIEGSLNAVTAGGPGLIAVGDASMDASDNWMAAVWTSTDGVTWSRVPPQPEVLGRPEGQSMLSVATGGPGLVAVGESSQGPTAWTSTDGITWSRVDTTTLHGRDAIETVLRVYAFGRA